MHLSIFCPPGGDTRGFRQKTIPDRREFDKLIESRSRVHRLAGFYIPGLNAPSRLRDRDLDFKHFKMSNPLGQPAAPPPRVGQNNDMCISMPHCIKISKTEMLK